MSRNLTTQSKCPLNVAFCFLDGQSKPIRSLEHAEFASEPGNSINIDGVNFP